jgi:hypothetical protein
MVVSRVRRKLQSELEVFGIADAAPRQPEGASDRADPRAPAGLVPLQPKIAPALVLEAPRVGRVRVRRSDLLDDLFPAEVLKGLKPPARAELVERLSDLSPEQRADTRLVSDLTRTLTLGSFAPLDGDAQGLLLKAVVERGFSSLGDAVLTAIAQPWFAQLGSGLGLQALLLRRTLEVSDPILERILAQAQTESPWSLGAVKLLRSKVFQVLTMPQREAVWEAFERHEASVPAFERIWAALYRVPALANLESRHWVTLLYRCSSDETLARLLADGSLSAADPFAASVMVTSPGQYPEILAWFAALPEETRAEYQRLFVERPATLPLFCSPLVRALPPIERRALTRIIAALPDTAMPALESALKKGPWLLAIEPALWPNVLEVMPAYDRNALLFQGLERLVADGVLQSADDETASMLLRFPSRGILRLRPGVRAFLSSLDGGPAIAVYAVMEEPKFWRSSQAAQARAIEGAFAVGGHPLSPARGKKSRLGWNTPAYSVESSEPFVWRLAKYAYVDKQNFPRTPFSARRHTIRIADGPGVSVIAPATLSDSALRQVIYAVVTQPVQLRRAVREIEIVPALLGRVAGFASDARQIIVLSAAGLTAAEQTAGLIDHEYGHHLHAAAWGLAAVPALVRWGVSVRHDVREWTAAADRDLVAPSGYAFAGVVEDFAETYAAYWGSLGTPEHDVLRSRFPNRFAILDQILGPQVVTRLPQ